MLAGAERSVRWVAPRDEVATGRHRKPSGSEGTAGRPSDGHHGSYRLNFADWIQAHDGRGTLACQQRPGEQSVFCVPSPKDGLAVRARA